MHVLLYFAVFLCGMISVMSYGLAVHARLFSVDFYCASNQAIWPCVMYADPRAGGEGVFVQSLWFLAVGLCCLRRKNNVGRMSFCVVLCI